MVNYRAFRVYGFGGFVRGIMEENMEITTNNGVRWGWWKREMETTILGLGL